METQRNPLLSWAYYCQGKVQTMEELKHSLLYTTVELEQTKLVVQDELRKKDDQLADLKDILEKALKERNEALEKCQSLLLEKLLLQQQLQQQQQQHQGAPVSGISSIEDEPKRGGIDSSNNGFSSSDCEESIVSSPVGVGDPIPHLVPDKPLPEKGKLLEAVMKAGPLLQTLLLAGPLPQWRTPPPPLESFEIPPVTIIPQLLHQQDSSLLGGCNNRKRVLLYDDGSDSSPSNTKYQRIALH